MILNKKITDTQFAKVMDMPYQIKQVVKYLTNNRNVVAPYELISGMYQTKPIIPTIINQLFEQMVANNYVEEFAVIYPVISKTSNNALDSLPDLLTMHDMVIDLKTAPHTESINTFYNLKNKILVNVAGLVKITDRGIVISDINELHSMYVRGMLTRSYSLSDGWLNSSISYYVIKCYCLIISALIAQVENLDFNDQMGVASILALYMSQKLSRSGEDPTKPSAFFRCSFLGNYSELNIVATRCAPLSQDGLTIPAVCELIAESGPARLNRFNAGTFYRICSRLGGSSATTITNIALEYPPYWMYMLLNCLSGAKFGSLPNLMKQYKLDFASSEAKRFMAEIRVSSSLLETK